MFDWFFTITHSAYFWLALLAFGILMYVILDGFDLGLGILFPWFDTQSQRQVMINSIAPFWDGNETWLVFGGVILLAAFPSAYGLILSSNYLAIMVMLLALVARGSAIEYRSKSDSSTKWWDRLFSYGSCIATFCQGYILGQLVQAEQSQFWLKGIFSLGCGFALMAGYALLGCCWILIKQNQIDMKIKACQLAIKLTIFVFIAMMLVSLFSLSTNPHVWQVWFSWPESILVLPLPLIALAIAIWLCIHLQYLRSQLPLTTTTHRALKLPFMLCILLFVVGFIGLWLGMTPNIVPGALTIHQALAPSNSLSFVSVGVVILLPVILAYTLYGYKVF